MPNSTPIQTALLSVSDKTDLIAFAKRLASHGVRFISTGGTAKALSEAGFEVTPISQITGFPEMMNGRVKTLHPKIHGGLLARRDNPEHIAAMKKYDIAPIDMVCVNLYPFEQTIAQTDVTDDEAIEQIDIGGPCMIRAAAKNHAHITVVTDPSQYDGISTAMDRGEGATSLALRQSLAAAAFSKTAEYDTAIAGWMAARWKSTPSRFES